MDIKTITQLYTVEVTTSIINIRNDISLVRVTKTCGNKVIDDSYVYCHPDNIAKFDSLNIEHDSNYNRLGVMRKGFLEAYKKTGFGLEAYNDLIETYEYYDAELLFDDLVDGKVNVSDLEIVEISKYDERFYPFVYGKTRTGFLPHMEPYSRACYMLTDRDYDIDKVYEYLIEKQKEGLVIIHKEHKNSEDNDKSEYVRRIPYYNHSSDSGDYFIDFHCFVENENQICDDKLFKEISYIKEELEQFKK